MEKEEYRLMFEMEKDHWWYRGLRHLIFSTLNKMSVGREMKILDAGCGTGFIAKELDKYGMSFSIDISRTALCYCTRRGLTRTARASVCRLPFADNSFDLVISADTLYHKEVENDGDAIREIHRVLKKKGLFVVNLPAYEHLRRAHDERVHTGRRYTLGGVCRKMRENNFKVLKRTYRNAFLYPAALLLALAKKLGIGPRGSDLKKTNRFLNTVLYGLVKAENALRGVANLPIGTSVFCVAEKI